jgi:deoxyribonuclease (pyrimidine dimer)
MTRINLIDPSELCDKHLLSEHRELIRIPNAVHTAKMQTKYSDTPQEYTLGSGHVKFFVDKMKWLCERHSALYDEIRFREFNVTEILWSEDLITFLKSHNLWNDYFPTDAEIQVNISRIIDRLPEKPKWKFREEPMYYET